MLAAMLIGGKRLVFGALLIASAAAGCKTDDDGGLDGPGQKITLYTRNLYLGSDIMPLVSIPSPGIQTPAARRRWARANRTAVSSSSRLESSSPKWRVAATPHFSPKCFTDVCAQSSHQRSMK